MIVVTGPGRSGTSLVASLYRELGFDPGGPWRPNDNAGLEDSAFVKANEDLLAALGTTVALGRRAPRGRWGRRGGRVDGSLSTDVSRIPGWLSEPLARSVDWSRYKRWPLRALDWSKLDSVTREYGERLRTMCDAVEVVKDPRFCWTLPAWFASGAPISAVVLSLRDLDAVVDSRISAFGHLVGEHGRGWAKNDFAYGIGLAVATACEHRVRLEILRFPDFLDDPGALYGRLPLPRQVSSEDFERAFEKVRDRSLVHDDR